MVFWVEELSPGETASINYVVELEGPLHGVQGLSFGNLVVAPVDGDVDPGNNQDGVVAYSGPDAYARKWLSDGTPRPGEIVTFTVQFGNQNGWPMDPAWGSHITDTLPAEMTYITSTAPWSPHDTWTPYDASGGVLRWGWGTAWEDSAWYYQVAVQITDTVQSGDVITNQIEYASSNPDDIDRDLADNLYRLPVTILNPGYDVAKSVEGSGVAGTVVTYTLTVTNVGNDAGTHVVLADTLPPGLTYLSGDGAWDGATVTWTFAQPPCSEKRHLFRGL